MRRLPIYRDSKTEIEKAMLAFNDIKAGKKALLVRVKCLHCGFKARPIQIPVPATYVCGKCDHPLFGCKKEVVFFHGGQSGLQVGAYLKPSSETGAKNTLVKYMEEMTREKGIRNPGNPDVVYLTTSYDSALLYAVMHPSGGHVYKVNPVGDVVKDEDCKIEGLSFGCRLAEIQKVIVPTIPEARRVFKAMIETDRKQEDATEQ